MIKGQIVDGLSVRSRVLPIEMDRAQQERNCVLKLGYSALTSGSTIYDVSGKGNHGTITGATWNRRPSGLWTLYFDSSLNHYVTCPLVSTAITNISFGAWYQTSDPTGDAHCIMYNGSANDGYGLVISWAAQPAGSLTLRFGGVGNIPLGFTTNTSWHFIMCTIGSTIKCYHDSVLAYDGAYVEPLAPTGNTFIGTDVPVTRDFVGDIAFVRFFTRVLSASEVAGIYHQERHLLGV